jgi:hypothetical protein
VLKGSVKRRAGRRRGGASDRKKYACGVGDSLGISSDAHISNNMRFLFEEILMKKLFLAAAITAISLGSAATTAIIACPTGSHAVLTCSEPTPTGGCNKFSFICVPNT